MTPKERHFEFMKVALTAYAVDKTPAGAARLACEYADAALAEFEKRWPEEEKDKLNCCGNLGECKRGLKKGCNGAHCRCMYVTCMNMHYVDCFEHYVHENKKHDSSP